MQRKIHHRSFALSSLIMGAAILLSCDSSSSVSPGNSSIVADNTTGDLSRAHVSGRELAFYQGKVYQWMSPAGSSSDPNQLVRACFDLGPDLNDHPSGPAGRLYALVLPGASQHACPDGSRRHDHVLSAIPGTPGYVPRWHLINVVPGPNFSSNIMPITSEQALLAAAAAGQVDIIQTGVIVLGPVLGLAQP